jgi:GNAT superfamily N-acetyltransferase
MTTAVEEFARALAFERRILEDTSTRVEPFAWGTAFLNESFPLRWDSNLLLVERPLAGVSAEALAAEADKVLADLAHREVVVPDEADGDRVALGLGRRGFEGDRLVVMALHRQADREPRDAGVEEVDFATVRPLIVEVNRRGHGGMSEESAQALADFREELVDRVGARFFLARVERELAGYCELYVRGGIAQIEDVNTLAEFRGRGLARAFVSRAAAEAREAEAWLVFLVADDTGWPKVLYSRLGFDPVGRYRYFVKRPEDLA